MMYSSKVWSYDQKMFFLWCRFLFSVLEILAPQIDRFLNILFYMSKTTDSPHLNRMLLSSIKYQVSGDISAFADWTGRLSTNINDTALQLMLYISKPVESKQEMTIKIKALDVNSSLLEFEKVNKKQERIQKWTHD